MKRITAVSAFFVIFFGVAFAQTTFFSESAQRKYLKPNPKVPPPSGCVNGDTIPIVATFAKDGKNESASLWKGTRKNWVHMGTYKHLVEQAISYIRNSRWTWGDGKKGTETIIQVPCER